MIRDMSREGGSAPRAGPGDLGRRRLASFPGGKHPESHQTGGWAAGAAKNSRRPWRKSSANALEHIAKRAPEREIGVDIPDDLLLVPMDAQADRAGAGEPAGQCDQAYGTGAGDPHCGTAGRDRRRFLCGRPGRWDLPEDLPHIFRTFYTSQHNRADAKRGSAWGWPSATPSSRRTEGPSGRKTGRTAARCSVSPYPWRWPKMRNLRETILIVEDDAQIRNFISFTLHSEGLCLMKRPPMENRYADDGFSAH